MNYIISTIQYNALVNKNLLKNLLKFADEHNVEHIYLYVMPGRYKDETLLPDFDDERIELLFLGKEGKKLNSNLKLHDTKILASQINPLTGFQSKLHRDFSYILPSPKIRFLSIPNTSSNPRILTTTGALTHGNYKDNAQGRKAQLEHEYGFAYVEVKNTRLFQYHPVMALKNGNFNYMREFYRNGKLLKQQPEALILGDWHMGETCQKARAASIKQIEELKPKRVFFHDLFDGMSINHWDRDNNFARAKLQTEGLHILEKEVEVCLDELNFFAKKFPEIEFVVVESNHDIRLSRYISSENFLTDGHNSVFACKLFVQAFTANQPILQTAMELVGDVSRNVHFLNQDEEYRIKGMGVGEHGHKGLNGARGSGASYDRFNLKLITGHEHTPKMYANGMVVGTNTKLKLPYTQGPSSWMHANGLLYSSGKYTMLITTH